MKKAFFTIIAALAFVTQAGAYENRGTYTCEESCTKKTCDELSNPNHFAQLINCSITCKGFYEACVETNSKFNDTDKQNIKDSMEKYSG